MVGEMKPADKAQLKGTAREVILAKDQPQYLPLAVAVLGDYVVSRWRLSFAERVKVLLNGNVFISMMNFNGPPMPILPSVEEPEWLL
jgi:predicted component of type VI protein secretion system